MRTRFAFKSTLAICFTVACSGAVTLLPRTAAAKSASADKSSRQPIGVGAVVGPQHKKVREKILKVLRDSGSYVVTDVEDVKPGSTAETYRNMAKGIQADAIVVGKVSKAMNLTVGVYAASGARVGSVQIKGGSTKGLLRAIDNQLDVSIADPLQRLKGGAGASATASADAEDEEEPDVGGDADAGGDDADAGSDDAARDDGASAAAASTGHGRTPLELLIGGRGYSRSFDYTDSKNPALVPYKLPFAPAVLGALRFYPAALWSSGVWSNLGIMARFEDGIATSTNYVDNGTTTALNTRASEFQVGLRGRLPLGDHELGVFMVYGQQAFALVGDEVPNTKAPYAVVPDVHYGFLRPGIDVRFNFSKLALGGHLAPRFLVAMGEIEKSRLWFAGATGSGLDFGIDVAYRLLSWLSVAAGGDVVRYGFDFNNLPPNQVRIYKGLPVVAGGATDTYISGWLGLRAGFDFTGSAAAGSASVSAKPAATEDAESEPAAGDDSKSDAKAAPDDEEEEDAE